MVLLNVRLLISYKLPGTGVVEVVREMMRKILPHNADP